MARAEVEASRAWGIPRSIFLGRPWPAPGEPLWLDSDRTWALALQAHEASIHDGCGQPVEESFSREGDGAYAAEGIRCHACAAIRRAQRDHAKHGEAALDGLSFEVRNVTKGRNR